MTTLPPKDALLADLDRVARDTLAYFEGPGRATNAQVDQWQARDVLMHFIYFHDATAWGIQSVAQGGPPWAVPADADTVNEICRRLHEDESFDELLTQLRQAHARLMRAARNAPDLDRPCFQRATGEVMTGRQRLELLARHWGEHVRELQEAASGRGTGVATETTYTLDQFLADTRATIRTKGIPSGLAGIRDHLEKLLRNPELLKRHLGEPAPYTERTTIGHDPETDVHVLVHGREKAGKSSVHDHGPCWVIYGNYRNPTRMRRWRRLDDGGKPGYAELEVQQEFLNEPGQAAVFAVGDIHSIEFGDDTFFIRVTGGDVESKQTLRFDVEKKSVDVAHRALGQR
jgi:hypothetical protein